MSQAYLQWVLLSCARESAESGSYFEQLPSLYQASIAQHLPVDEGKSKLFGDSSCLIVKKDSSEMRYRRDERHSEHGLRFLTSFDVLIEFENLFCNTETKY